jgi:hypothetical protein
MMIIESAPKTVATTGSNCAKGEVRVRSVLPLMISYSLLHVAGDRGCSGLRGLERAHMTVAGAASSNGGSPAASRCRCS